MANITTLYVGGQPLSASSNVTITVAPGELTESYTNATNIQLGLANFGTPSTCAYANVTTDIKGRSTCVSNPAPITSLSNGVGTYVSGTNRVNSYFASVKDFGAVGDNVTDDTSAIQAALNSANFLSIYFPAGIYVITTSLNSGVNGKTLYSLEGATIMARGFLVQGNLLNLKHSNFTLRGITLDGGSARDPNAVPVHFISFAASLAAGLTITNVMLDGCLFTNTNGYGLFSFVTNATLSFLSIVNCEFSFFGSQRGSIQLNGPYYLTDVLVSGCNFHDNVGGAQIGAIDGFLTRARFQIVGNVINLGVNSYTSGGINAEGARDVTVSNNIFSNCRIAQSIVDCDEVTVTGNVYDTIFTTAIEHYSNRDITITGNTFKDTYRGILFGISTGTSRSNIGTLISSNTFSSSNSSDFVYNVQPSEKTTITGNEFRYTNSSVLVYAVRMDAQSGGVSINGNRFTDCTMGFTNGTATSNIQANDNYVELTQDLPISNNAGITLCGTNVLCSGNQVISKTVSVNIGAGIANPGTGDALTNALFSDNVVTNFAIGFSTNIGNPNNVNLRIIDNVAVSCTTDYGSHGTDSVRQRRIFHRTAVPTTGTWDTGDTVLQTYTSGSTGQPWGWQCIAAGTPGTWQPLGVNGGILALTIVGDVDATLTPGSNRPTLFYSTPITANRVVTLSSTGAWSFLTWRIARGLGCTGSFNITIGSGSNLCRLTNPGQFCEYSFGASAYNLVGGGTFPSA